MLKPSCVPLLRGLCLVGLFGFSSYAHAQRRVTIAWSELPDAPGQSTSTQAPAGLGRVTGNVVDVSGAAVPGATVRLVLMSANHPERVATADDTGAFVIPDVAAGDYRLTVTAQGLESYVSPDFIVNTGQTREVTGVKMAVATANVAVNVVFTQEELAREELHEEEKQRLLGVVPNFYSSYDWKAAPLSARQKFALAGRAIGDPTAIAGTAVLAVIQHGRDTYPGYGVDLPAFGERFGADYADLTIARMVGSAVLTSVLHQDPRYFYKGAGTVKQRALYAVGAAFFCRGDNGKWQPNYSKIGGSFTAAAVANAYRTPRDRGFGATITNGFIVTSGNIVSNLAREFLLRRLTPSVPDYKQGQPRDEAK